MKLQMHSIKFDADSKLLDVVQKKMDKLETYYDRVINGEVFLRLNNEGIKNKTVEIKLNIPGDQLFAVATDKSFEAATEEATEALRRQLKKYKQRIMSH
ncbi:MAG: ribosome-associated translation inhibitor RaiA [Cyclobacteriaceae bacterium]|nr:ribosome-associated translation inhibitor RaiA [Cyclobacteriaceae bacterium]